MQKIKADIYLEDEAPRIGTGWRRVHLQVGRKYVYVLTGGKRVRIPTATFRTLKVTAPRSRWTDQMEVLP